MTLNREDTIFNCIENAIKYPILRQKRISNYRVDFYIEISNNIIIVECDEWCHSDKNAFNEYRRMIHINELLRRLNKHINVVHFIRFCPDAKYCYRKNIKYKKSKTTLVYRINELIKTINLAPPLAGELRATYLFYSPICPSVSYISKFPSLCTLCLRMKIDFKNEEIIEADKFKDLAKKAGKTKIYMNEVLNINYCFNKA